MRLRNKVAVVTGSTSGIGLAIAQLFATEGAKVVIAARKEELANQIVADIKAKGGEAMFARLEVARKEDWLNMVEQVKREYGALHILVNNAGTNELCALPNIDFEQWDKVMAINVTGPMMGIQLCAPVMKESGGGSIVNISSIAGMQGTPNTAYSTSKWALNGLSGSAAYSLAGWGIRSNVICPGFIANTNLTNAISEKAGGNPMDNIILLGRSGQPSELAQTALFLASDESSYVTGVNIPVDGGLTDAGHYSVMRPQLAMFTGGQQERK
jgi:NAD(P)-dependent dehydrogenase (short-subunit alcohol dehydrogenase family)